MKHKKLRITFAVIITLLLILGVVAAIFFVYKKNLNTKILWISLLVGIFLLDAIFGIIVFNSKKCADETKSFWLFVILVLPLSGFVFYLFLGNKKDKGYSYGLNNQTILLSAIFQAKKSIKIYTNSLFISYDTERAINYASWKHIDVKFLVTMPKKKGTRKNFEFLINTNLEARTKVYFTHKQIDKCFIIIDDEKVLLTENNFNYKYMYHPSKIYKTFQVENYLKLWNNDITRSSLFHTEHKKYKWTVRFKYGIINIFYPFY